MLYSKLAENVCQKSPTKYLGKYRSRAATPERNRYQLGAGARSPSLPLEPAGMRRKPKFREPVAVLQRRNVAAMAALAPSAEREAQIRAEFEHLYKAMPKKRAPSTAKSEKEIQKEILDYLRDHPRVAWAHRFNRGTAVSQDEHGRTYHVKFNTCPGFSDIHLLLKSGRPGYVEVKVPGKSPTDDQADFLLACYETGALSMVARSVEDMERALCR